MQMEMQRLVAQGRLSECLASNIKTITIDTFFRQLGFARDATHAIATGQMGPKVMQFLSSYSDGVNLSLF